MILPFDELNVLQEKYSMPFLDVKKVEKEQVIDEVYDLLIMAYIYGVSNVDEWLGVPLETDTLDAEKVIFDKTDGKTFEGRINAYFDASYDDGKGGLAVDIAGQKTDLMDAINRIAETETTRVFNEAMLRNARKAEKETGRTAVKTWRTMGDDRVRDTHDFLEGTTIPVNEKFWTYDGDEAFAPGGFSKASNVVNCRCFLEYGWKND